MTLTFKKSALLFSLLQVFTSNNIFATETTEATAKGINKIEVNKMEINHSQIKQNPVLSIKNVDVADPDIIFYQGKYYMYPTTVPSKDWLSTSMHVYSSDDLAHWQDEGEILGSSNIHWDNKKFWAPTIEERDGIFYLYFSLNHNIGVATSSSPTGPFVDVTGKPIITGHIDPDVFVDKDGQGYLFYGQNTPRVRKLKDNLVDFDSEEILLSAPNFREGVYMFTRNNKYYLSWSVDDARSENYHLEYSIGDSPLGPFTYQGVLLQRNENKVGTGHHSVINAANSDDWYVVYHRHFVPDGGGQYREIAIQKMSFKADGTIEEVIPKDTFIGL